MRDLPDEMPLDLFLSRWYGPPPRKPADQDRHEHLPPELREWHRTIGRRDDAALRRAYLFPAELIEFDGKPVFMCDSDGDGMWSFDPGAAVHRVHVRDHGDEDWQPTGLSLRRFLLLNAASMIALIPPFGSCSWTATEDEAAHVLARMTPVPHASLTRPTPGARLHAGDDTLALVAPAVNLPPGHPPALAVLLAARTPAALDAIGPPTGDHWWRRP